MVTLYNPDTRTNMAVREIANYIIYFTNWTIMISNKHYQKACGRLEKFTNQFVSLLMANMFTAANVRPVNQCYNNDTAFKNKCDKIAPLVLKSVIHNLVKVLVCILTLPIQIHLIIIKSGNVIWCIRRCHYCAGWEGWAQMSDGTHMMLDVRGLREILKEWATLSCWDNDIQSLLNTERGSDA
jgi:hypothetical protein